MSSQLKCCHFPHIQFDVMCSDLKKLQKDISAGGISASVDIPLPSSVSAILSDVPALVALIKQANDRAGPAGPPPTAPVPSHAAAAPQTARPSVQVPSHDPAVSSANSAVAPSSAGGVPLPPPSAPTPAMPPVTPSAVAAAAQAAAAAASTPAASPAATADDLALLASNEVISEPGAPTAALSAAIAGMLGASMTGTPKRLQRVVSQCAGHKVGYIFAEPVTEAIAPGYSKIVAHPMDLSTMRDRITAGDIGSWTGLADALCLMCRNALVYNPPASEVHQATLAFFDHALRLVQDGSGGKDFGRSDEATASRAVLVQQVLTEAAAVKASLGLVDAEGGEGGGAGDDDEGGRRGGVKRRSSVAAKQGPGDTPRSAAKRPRR